jgi:3-(3-hydroxy-phenyl)propionate hydroxylase
MGQAFLNYSPRVAAARDAFFRAIQRIGRVRRFIRNFEFKPPPLHSRGLIAGGRRPRGGAQGTYFPQALVPGPEGERLSDAYLGPNFAVVGLDVDPRVAGQDVLWDRLPARLVRVCTRPAAPAAGVVDVRDASGRLAGWFHRHRAALAIVRPDRHVFAAGPAGAGARLGAALARALQGET